MKWVGALARAIWPKEAIVRDTAQIKVALAEYLEAQKAPDPTKPYKELQMADLSEVPLRLRIYRTETTKAGKIRYIYITALFEGYSDAELYLRIPPSKFTKLIRLLHKRSSNAAKNYLRGALYESYFIHPTNKKQRELFTSG